MTATVIQFVPRPNPNRDMQAIEIANVKLVGPTLSVVDPSGIALFYQIEGHTGHDPYTAPDKDEA
jgi:hypothetical protein